MESADIKLSIKYDRKIVVFIDILGFKNFIAKSNDYIDEVEKINVMFDEIISNVNQYKNFKLDVSNGNSIEVANKNISDFHLWYHNTEITVFSDSIVFSIASNGYAKLLEMLRKFQFNMSCSGYFLRGGIVFGNIIHEDSKIFGQAMIDAHDLESKHAVYPRIIIDKKISEYIDQHQKYYEENLLKQDLDGYSYIDYISPCDAELIEKLEESVKKNLQNTTDSSVIWKMEWIKSKIQEIDNKNPLEAKLKSGIF